MAIPILSEIERLINEHGSALILKERLALAADKYSALENESSSLKEENARLRLDYEECEKQRCALEKKLSEQHPPPPQVINNGPGSWVKARRGR